MNRRNFLTKCWQATLAIPIAVIGSKTAPAVPKVAKNESSQDCWTNWSSVEVVGGPPLDGIDHFGQLCDCKRWLPSREELLIGDRYVCECGRPYRFALLINN